MVGSKTKIVGILRGGTGNEYEKSLREGGKVLSLIRENLSANWKPVDILIDRDGVWHFKGVPIQPADLINKVDVVWNASHPSQATLFKNLSIPHVGHSIFSKTLSESKEMLKEHMDKIGVKMPRHFVIPVYQADFDGPKDKFIIKKAQEVLHKFPAPWIIKTFTPDSNTAIHLVKTYPELVEAIAEMVEHNRSILVEEFISGKIVSVHSVLGFRGEEVYTFPCLPTSTISGNFKSNEKEKLIELTKNIHAHLGKDHYLRSDFILTPRGNIFLINVDFSPDLQKDSHLDQVCEFVGAKTHHVIEHILEKTSYK